MGAGERLMKQELHRRADLIEEPLMPDNPHQAESLPPWQIRLAEVMEMMRETSRQTDPQEMVATYGRRMAKILPADRRISLSRRDLLPPRYRITRYSQWKKVVNPWKQVDQLPILEGGFLGQLLYAGEPRLIDDLRLEDQDPSSEYLAGQRSLMAVPLLDQGEALNMVVITRSQPNAFDRQQFPEIVWTSNLFGRSTHNLVLADRVKSAYDLVDRELQTVGNIQRALLPAEVPSIPNMRLAAHYQTSHRAGGDYYDFFPLRDGRWGILIADVSGHGTPAAVMMAVTHSIAHMYPGTSARPSDMLNFVNRHLSRRYTNHVGSFVTAFYGIYDPASRELIYSSAGHNPPRIRRCGGGAVTSLDGARDYPLGVDDQVEYRDERIALRAGDQIVFYTDGVTEAVDPQGRLFDVARLDEIIAQCRDEVDAIIRAILQAVDDFTAGQPATDDRTLVVAKVS
jgi:sigma-B regulation protein RsbU (phosphoserine phosphatase)